MEEDQLINKIERYLSGDLSPSEVAAFEDSFSKDPSLEAQVELHLKAKAAAFISGRNAQRELLGRRFDTLMISRRQQRRTRILQYTGIAAGICLLAFIGFYWVNARHIPTTQELYAAYYVQPDASEIRSQDVQAAIHAANLNFNQQNYAAAIPQYRALLQNETLRNREELTFFLGISLLKINLLDEAISTLSTISGLEYGEMAEWYTALIYLNKSDLEGIQSRLKTILAKPSHHYYQQATQLQKEIERIEAAQ